MTSSTQYSNNNDNMNSVPIEVIPNTILLSDTIESADYYHEFFLVSPSQTKHIYNFLHSRPRSQGWLSLGFHAIFINYCIQIADSHFHAEATIPSGTAKIVCDML
ncbi:hypothetical protein EJ08DRAFT_646592 [Tothia fuscella]|uniref:Uncharacterized protein n=1 Tax=Tothia fuscella TaxID=1048955 RepID=A0A9P4NZJ7_9PEZI|nr:hypothetical protein EJ08DRAFT_646592 [Tothia fuscella]